MLFKTRLGVGCHSKGLLLHSPVIYPGWSSSGDFFSVALDGKSTAGEGLLVRKHNDNQEARSPQGLRQQNHLAVRLWHNCARVQSHLEEMYGTAVSPT
jgi:hypothetical protein